MWAGKWVLCSIITGEDIFSLAYRGIVIRSGHVSNDLLSGFTQTVLNTSFFMYSNKLLLFVSVLVLIFYFINFCYCYYRHPIKKIVQSFNVSQIYMLLVSFSPILWFLIFQNHSFIHSWMTYRILSILIFGFSILFVQFTCKENFIFKREKSIKS